MSKNNSKRRATNHHGTSNDTNRNSRITTRSNGSNRYTITDGRDLDSMFAAIVTHNNRTDFTIERAGKKVEFSGREARTLLKLLDKHFNQ